MTNPFSFLAAQVRKGRRQEADKLGTELRPWLEHQVRRILCIGDDGSPMSNRVRRESQRLYEGEAIPFESEPMVKRVAERIWQDILEQLQSGPARRCDTWRLGQTAVAC